MFDESVGSVMKKLILTFIALKVLVCGCASGNVTIPIHNITIVALRDRFAICPLDPSQPWPQNPTDGRFFSITSVPMQPTDARADRDSDRRELSLIVPEDQAPTNVTCERPWRALRIRGPLPFNLVGIIASVVGPLARAGISVFTLSTFNTDFVMTKAADFERAQSVLRSVHHVVQAD